MRTFPIALAAMLVAFALPAHASNVDFLKYAPISRLTAPELKEFKAAVDKMLDEAPDGQAVQWKAPKSEFNASMTPMKRVTEGKRECRDARFETEARELKASGVYTFCKSSKGWQIKSPPAAKKK
jgi:hypothetical protein